MGTKKGSWNFNQETDQLEKHYYHHTEKGGLETHGRGG